MHVDVIEGFQRFSELRENWDAVYDADPEAQFFLSSAWMSDWLTRLDGPWFILAAKPAIAAAYVAFMPMRLRTRERKDGSFYNELNMVGNYAADYTGFIVAPEAEGEAIPALARHMRRLNWTHLNLDNLRASEQRTRLFLRGFTQRAFDIEEVQRINKKDGINNCICPFIELPGAWDDYLAGLSTNMRQKIRRFLRQVDNSDELRISLAGPDTIDRDVKILLRFWATRWGARKGARLENIMRSNFATLRRSFENGSLFLPVLWKNDTPLAALASFVDPRKKALLFYISGREETFSNPPPGLVLHAYSIRHAIGRGIATYDFLRGNEPYKYSFGARERLIRCIRVSTRNRQNLGDRIDRRSLPAVLRRATALHQAGQLAAAECGYRQILDVMPREPTTLYRFGQLMEARGHRAAARRLFKALVAVRPDSYKAWLKLALSLHAQHRFSEAERAYREVIRLRPDNALAHGNLGHVLARLGRDREAVEVFETALGLQPGDPKAERGLAHALDRIGRLPPRQQARHGSLNGHHNPELAAQKASLGTTFN